MEAQFERYATYGLPLAHVDGHLHMHVHPTVFDLLVPLAESYGAGGLRLPHDDFWLAMGHSRQRALTKTTWAVIFGLLTARCRKRLDGSRLAVADRVYGLMQTGQMEEAYVLKLLSQMRVPTAEIYFHPSLAPDGDGHDGRQVDLEALLSPAVRRAIQDRGLRLATYATLGGE
jgi:predicted glycoside hydrolase/deacetylase ChbG (UPF0249 family)